MIGRPVSRRAAIVTADTARVICGGMTHLLGAWSSATGWGWVRIGRVYAMDSIAGTLDAHLKQCLAGATAGWVAVMLETAGVVHLDRTPPAKVTPNR